MNGKTSSRLDIAWWQHQNETDFAALKSELPCPLALHRERCDDADRAILEGKKIPS